MESRSLPGMCQVSDSTFKQLVKAKYLFKKREPMPIKGKVRNCEERSDELGMR